MVASTVNPDRRRAHAERSHRVQPRPLASFAVRAVLPLCPLASGAGCRMLPRHQGTGMSSAIVLLLAAAVAVSVLAESTTASTFEAAGEQAYSQPWHALDARQTERFVQGREIFRQRW